MKSKKNYNPFQGANFDRFNNLRQQLQKQNVMLLRERQAIQDQNDNFQPVPSQHTVIQREEPSFEQEVEYNEQLPRFQAGSTPNKQTYEHRSFRQNVGSSGEMISDDLVQMIQQIQRKALNQIQSLRADKISLLKQLNIQIRAHNNEKSKRSQLLAQQKNNGYQQNKRRVKTVQSQQRIEPAKIPNIIYQQQQQNSPSPGQNYRNYQSNDEAIQYIQNKSKIYPKVNPNHNAHSIHQQRSTNGGKANKNNQIMKPQSVPVSRNLQGQTQFSNKNIQPAQSFYYLDNKSARGQQQGIQNQYNRLKQQNLQMRNTISRYGSQTNIHNNENKNKLRHELKNLQDKAQYYHQALSKGNRENMSTQGFDGSQLETLMLQGANLAQQGHRLMKVKSNPDFNTTSNINIESRNNFTLNKNNEIGNSRYNNEVNGKFNHSHNFIQTPVNTKNVQSQNNYNNNSRFSPGEYEKLIENIRRAAQA